MATYLINQTVFTPVRRSIKRYCHNCGQVVEFTDSGKQRQNANGKKIFVYEIYKCPKDHTWNNPQPGKRPEPAPEISSDAWGKYSISDLKTRGFDPVVLRMEQTAGKLRLDRALAETFTDLSRTQIQQWMETGRIRVNGRTVKAKFTWVGVVEVTVIPE